MFSREFVNTLSNSVAAVQRDPAASQVPAVQHLTDVLRVLWREVERIERSISVANHEIVVRCGSASIVLKTDGSITIKGANVTIEAAGNVALKAGGTLALKAARIVQS